MEKKCRIAYIDNLRWIIVVLVVIFHVIDIFNSTGTIIHYNAPGIQAFDSFAYIVYPWFMALLFVISGMSVKYALNKRNLKDFVKNRTLRLLVPFVFYIIVFAPLTSYFSLTVSGGWRDFANIPPLVMYFIMLCIGMGHLWFVLELYVISMIFVLIKKLDRKNFLQKLGNKTNITVLFLLYIPLLGAAQILNLLGVFRNLLFLLLFLLGYFVFSNECITDKLVSIRKWLLPLCFALCVLQMYMYWGQSFSGIVNKPVVMLYTWITILYLIGFGKAHLDFSNSFTEYMSSRSYLTYITHYFPMIIIAYLIVRTNVFPIFAEYMIVLILSFAAAFILNEIIMFIPPLRFLFGAKKTVSAKS